MKISMDKKYKTRAGADVTIYAVDVKHDVYTVHGAIGADVERWRSNGSCYTDNPEGVDSDDLVEVLPRIKKTLYVNMYVGGSYSTHADESEADRNALENRLARTKVEIDCEVGEGL